MGSAGGMVTIGELATAVGVPESTIRYWERRGLVTPTAWQSGQRRYDAAALAEVRLLRVCQEVGFSLTEIWRLREHRQTDRAAWRRFVRDKLEDLQRRQTQIEHTRTLLEHAVTCEFEYILECPSFQDWFSRWEPPEQARRAPAAPRPGRG